ARAGLTGRARARSKDLPVRAPGKRPLRDGESGRSAFGAAPTGPASPRARQPRAGASVPSRRGALTRRRARPQPAARTFAPPGGCAWHAGPGPTSPSHAPLSAPTMPFSFHLEAEDAATGARAGRFRTAHGDVLTPAFLPVGTVGSVKSLAPDDLTAAGCDVLLCNTYHLMLRPGADTVRRLGWLQRFMGWDAALLTDSGGFQVMSLTELNRVREEGVEFRSHLDGSRHLLSPEEAIRV